MHGLFEAKSSASLGCSVFKGPRLYTRACDLHTALTLPTSKPYWSWIPEAVHSAFANGYQLATFLIGCKAMPNETLSV